MGKLVAICWWRAMAIVIGGWLLLVSFATGFGACETHLAVMIGFKVGHSLL